MQYKGWIEKNQFESQIKNSPTAHVTVFAATWCGYCRRFLSIMNSYNPTRSAAEVSVVNIDSGDGSLWDEFHIDLVPTLIVFKNGTEIDRHDAKPGIGLTKEDLVDAISAATAV